MGASTKTVTVAETVTAAGTGPRKDGDRGKDRGKGPDFKDTGKGPDSRPDNPRRPENRGGQATWQGPRRSGPKGPSSASKEPLGNQGGQGPYKGPAHQRAAQAAALQGAGLQGSRRRPGWAQGEVQTGDPGGRRQGSATARGRRHHRPLQGVARAAGRPPEPAFKGPPSGGQNQPAFKGPPQQRSSQLQSAAKAGDAGPASAAAPGAAPAASAGAEAGQAAGEERREEGRQEAARLATAPERSMRAAVSLGTAARICCAGPFAPSIRRACRKPNRAPPTTSTISLPC